MGRHDGPGGDGCAINLVSAGSSHDSWLALERRSPLLRASVQLVDLSTENVLDRRGVPAGCSDEVVELYCGKSTPMPCHPEGQRPEGPHTPAEFTRIAHPRRGFDS
jgi:hypothetical protein